MRQVVTGCDTGHEENTQWTVSSNYIIYVLVVAGIMWNNNRAAIL